MTSFGSQRQKKDNNLMGPPSSVQSVVDRNVVMQRMTVYGYGSSMLTS